jgi:hypothetical protein
MIFHIDLLHQLHIIEFNALNAELNPICHLVALLGVRHFPHVSRMRVKSLTLRLLMAHIYIYIYIYIYDISHLRVKVHPCTGTEALYISYGP